MKNLIENVKVKSLPLTEKGLIKQNDRNALRLDIVNGLATLLTNSGADILLTKEGIAIELPHNELGSVVAMVGVTVKGLDFDIVTANAEYLQAINDKLEKEKERKAKAKKG